MQEIKQMGDYCPECSALAAKGVWEGGTHRYRHNGKHELTIECRPLPHSPAAPPKDAKALEDAIEQLTQDANFAEAIGQASDRAFAADLRTVINAARSRERYAIGEGEEVCLMQKSELIGKLLNLGDFDFTKIFEEIDIWTAGHQSGGNYTANDSTFPTEVTFQNGRKVGIAFDGDKPYLTVGIVE